MRTILSQPLWFTVPVALIIVGAVLAGVYGIRLWLDDRRAERTPELVSWQRPGDGIEPADMTPAQIDAWLRSGVYARPEWVGGPRVGILVLDRRELAAVH